MFRTLLAGVMALSSASVFAHPGHDHNHWLSEPIHFVSILAAVALASVAIVAIKRRQAKSKLVPFKIEKTNKR